MFDVDWSADNTSMILRHRAAATASSAGAVVVPELPTKAGVYEWSVDYEVIGAGRGVILGVILGAGAAPKYHVRPHPGRVPSG